MEPKARRLAYGLGAELDGLDITKPIDHDTVAWIRAQWLEHLVIVIPDQDLSIEQHIAFSARFGKLELHPQKHYRHPEFPEIFEVSNRVINGKKSDSADAGRMWHSDGCFSLRPPTGSMLFCEDLPPVGGDTWFTNMYAAYDGLSETMKRMVDPLEVVNDLALNAQMRTRDPAKVTDHLRDNRSVVQPMVRTHPETGRKALYLNETVTRQIHGMTEEESEGIIKYLFKHSIRPEYTYRHRWRRHDLLIWDNRCTMHLAPGDYDRSQLRHMRRTTLEGEPLGRYEEAA